MQQCQQNVEIQNDSQCANSSGAATAATLHNGHVIGIEPPQHPQQLQGFSCNSAVDQIQQCRPIFSTEEQKSLQQLSINYAANQMWQYQPILSSQPENKTTQNMGAGSTFPSSANRYKGTEQIHLTQDYNTNRMPSSSATISLPRFFLEYIILGSQITSLLITRLPVAGLYNRYVPLS